MCMCDCVANMAVVHALHFQNSYYKLYCLVHCFKSGTLAILKVAFLDRKQLISSAHWRRWKSSKRLLLDAMIWCHTNQSLVHFFNRLFIVQLLNEHFSIGWCQCIHISKSEPFPIELFLWFDLILYNDCWNFQALLLFLVTFCSQMYIYISSSMFRAFQVSLKRSTRSDPWIKGR